MLFRSITNTTGYSIERSVDGTQWTAIADIRNKNVTTYTAGSAGTYSLPGDITLTSGTNYFFRIMPTNSAGLGATSTKSGTPLGTPNAPGSLTRTGKNTAIILTWSEPTSLAGRTISGYQVKLDSGAWSAVPGISTSYKIGRAHV